MQPGSMDGLFRHTVLPTPLLQNGPCSFVPRWAQFHGHIGLRSAGLNQVTWVSPTLELLAG